jgi:hypothetical protein
MNYLNLARALDPVLLMRDAGYVADPWQEKVLRSSSSRLLILAPRQVGKSLTCACLALHTAIYQPGSLTLIASRSEDQSIELFRKMIVLYNELGRPVPPTRQLLSEIELANGSRVEALPNNDETVRSRSSVSLLILDEASRIPDKLIIAVMPMVLASQGRIIALSTPSGQKGFFYEQFVNPHARWEHHVAKVSECPRFDPVDLAEQRQLLGELGYRQEMECEFLQSEHQVFSTSSIDDAFDSELEAIQGF